MAVFTGHSDDAKNQDEDRGGTGGSEDICHIGRIKQEVHIAADIHRAWSQEDEEHDI